MTKYDVAFGQLIEENELDWWEILENEAFIGQMAEKTNQTVDEITNDPVFDKWHTMACQEL